MVSCLFCMCLFSPSSLRTVIVSALPGIILDTASFSKQASTNALTSAERAPGRGFYVYFPETNTSRTSAANDFMTAARFRGLCGRAFIAFLLAFPEVALDLYRHIRSVLQAFSEQGHSTFDLLPMVSFF